MLTLVAILTLATDGGVVAPIPFDGHLEAEKTYELVSDDALTSFRPPSLKLPFHHAGRVEWADDALARVPKGRVRLVFAVETIDVVRMTSTRWNSTYHCRLISAEPVAAK